MLRFALALLLSCLTTIAVAAPPRAVVFDFELIDTSLSGEMNGVSKTEVERLTKLAPILREKLNASGKYEIVALSPDAEKQAKAANLQSCGGCDVAIAKQLGADLAITGTVQKVSELILNINIYIRDTKTGSLNAVMSADIRNNTDESWLRGLDYIIRNRLLASDETPEPRKAKE